MNTKQLKNKTSYSIRESAFIIDDPDYQEEYKILPKEEITKEINDHKTKIPIHYQYKDVSCDNKDFYWSSDTTKNQTCSFFFNLEYCPDYFINNQALKQAVIGEKMNTGEIKKQCKKYFISK